MSSERSGRLEALQRDGRAAGEIVRARRRQRDRAEHLLLRSGRAAAVVDAEPGRHHDEQRPEIPEPELRRRDSARSRRACRTATGSPPGRRPSSISATLTRSPWAYTSFAACSSAALAACEGAWVREVDVLQQQVVARRVAVRPRTPACRRARPQAAASAAEGCGTPAGRPRPNRAGRSLLVAARRLRLVDAQRGSSGSLRGLRRSPSRLRAPCSSFLTTNVCVPVS